MLHSWQRVNPEDLSDIPECVPLWLEFYNSNDPTGSSTFFGFFRGPEGTAPGKFLASFSYDPMTHPDTEDLKGWEDSLLEIEGCPHWILVPDCEIIEDEDIDAA